MRRGALGLVVLEAFVELRFRMEVVLLAFEAASGGHLTIYEFVIKIPSLLFDFECEAQVEGLVLNGSVTSIW